MQSSSQLVRIDLVEGTKRGEVQQVEWRRQQNNEQVIRERERPGMSELGRRAS